VASAVIGGRGLDQDVRRYAAALEELVLQGEDFSNVPHGLTANDLKDETVVRELAGSGVQAEEFEGWLKRRESANK
jgi:hypothetical protein